MTTLIRDHEIEPPEEAVKPVSFRDTPAHVRDAEQDAICHELNRLQRLPDDMLTAMLVGVAEELYRRKTNFRGTSRRTVRIELAVEYLVAAQRY